jgi:hypothetical protein
MVVTRNQKIYKMKPSKNMAIIIIQRNYRKYLNNRYRKLQNWDDNDSITQTSIKLIPKNEILVLKKRGYDGPNLIKWINTFDINNSPSHPNFRTEYDNSDMKKIIKFGFKYLESIKESDYKTEFVNTLYELLTKEIIRNY